MQAAQAPASYAAEDALRAEVASQRALASRLQVLLPHLLAPLLCLQASQSDGSLCWLLAACSPAAGVCEQLDGARAEQEG